MKQQVTALVEQHRAHLLENTNYGMVCGVNDKQQLIYELGDASQLTYLRSAAKPIQAISAVRAGVPQKFGLSGEEVAMFAASHRGEAYHIAALESMLHKIGVTEDVLYTHPTYPLNEEPRMECMFAGKPKRRLYHNCSGKHLGVIALCKLMGYPLETYWHIDHPAQQDILHTLSSMADCPVDEIKIGTDGCGFPVFALPLRKIAAAYLKLACPDLIEDEQTQRAVQVITGHMNAHPRMIASHNFICSVLLEDENIVAKGGAKGIYALGLKRERVAFAFKVMDGSEAPWPLIAASILEQIGYENQETIERLHRLTRRTIINDNGDAVGENKAVFRL